MPQYTKEQRYNLIKKFNDMDISGDKQLSKDEIRKCVEASSLPPEKVDEFLHLFDNNGDDKVTLDEYERALCLKPVVPTTIEHWRETFDEMDVDKSGKLTVDEMYQGLLKSGCELSKDRIVDIVKSADDDGDRSLTFKEFSTLMRL
ncbi:hypothetical protein ACTXT7_011898 [Hymenolepis weldensis]